MAKSNDPQRSRVKDNAYLKYSGMAFQIIAYILVGIFLGDRLDKHFENEQPVFTAILAMVFLCLFFYKLYVDLNRK